MGSFTVASSGATEILSDHNREWISVITSIQTSAGGHQLATTHQ